MFAPLAGWGVAALPAGTPDTTYKAKQFPGLHWIACMLVKPFFHDMGGNTEGNSKVYKGTAAVALYHVLRI